MDATIRVNNTKADVVEFNINIQGGASNDNAEPEVRFVITNVLGGELSFKCEQSAEDSSKWAVKLPPLPSLSQKTDAHEFRLELIIGGYYFEPARGNLVLMRNPEVTVSKAAKPKVTAQIVQKDKEPEKTAPEPKEHDKDDEEKEDKKPVTEIMAAGDIQDFTAPNAALLTPEFPPDNDAQGDERARSHHRRMPEDEDILPPEPDIPAENIAEKIIIDTIGARTKRPSKPGFLFQRGDSGRPVIEGIEPDSVTKKKMTDKARRIREALGQKSS